MNRPHTPLSLSLSKAPFDTRRNEMSRLARSKEKEEEVQAFDKLRLSGNLDD